MNSLPLGWVDTRFEAIADIQLGKMLDKAKNVGLPTAYLRNINIRWGKVDTSDVLTMPMSSEDRSKFSINDGDVLVCEGGEPGRAAVWRAGPTDLKFQKAIIRVRAANGISPDWIAQYLRLASKDGTLSKRFTGTTIKHLPREALQATELPLPPIAEQHRIVAKVDSLLAKSKCARDQLDRVPKLVKKYKAAILAAAFGGKSTSGRNTLDKNAWVPTTVGQISDITSGFGFPKEHQGKQSGDFPFAKVSDISRAVAEADGYLSSATNYVDGHDLRALRARPIPAGSTVFAKIGEALRLNRRALTQVDLVLDNNCMAVTPCRKQVDPEFLYHFMTTVDLNPFAVATAVPSVRRGDVAAVALRLPSIEEQQEIVRRIRSAFAWIDRLAAEANSARRLIEHVDQAILAKAFRGELVPQDPGDEPASALLERIRAKRVGAPAAKRRGRPNAPALL